MHIPPQFQTSSQSQLRVLFVRVEQLGRERGHVPLGGPRRPTHVLPTPAQRVPGRAGVPSLPRYGGESNKVTW